MVAVVLLPGMDGSGALFADFISELKASSTVVAYPPEQPIGYGELRQLVRASLPNEPFVLLAESFSGPIAISLASEQLPHLRAIVLVCSFAKLSFIALPSPLRRLASVVPFWRLPVSLAARVLLGRFRSPAVEAKLAQAMRVVSPSVWKARVRAVLEEDQVPSLCRIQVPVLYIRASEDRVVLSSASAVISRHVSRMKVVEIEGPHFLLQARPRESAAAIRAFADEHGLAL